jgi:hypothetical protein
MRTGWVHPFLKGFLERIKEMPKTVVALFDDFEDASTAVQDLVDTGFPKADISLIANDPSGDYETQVDMLRKSDAFERLDAAEGATVGAGVGAAIGGLGGLLIGLGAFAIPGIGPVVAAGPLASALAGLVGAGAGAIAGGAAGSLLGALIDLGIPEEVAHEFAEGLRRGGHLVILSTSQEMSAQAVEILDHHGAVNIKERSQQWRESGWKGTFQENAGPHPGDATKETFPPDYHRSELSTDYDDFRAYEASFRNHFNNSTDRGSYSFDDYEPAYRYGYSLANDPRYRDWAWEDVEAEAHQHWEDQYPNTWDRFKHAVRHAWIETKETIS